MTDTSKHIKNFKIENFKCFDSFELEDVGQFNLILGDNNVGKTSVLEALLFDEDLRYNLISLVFILTGKNKSISDGQVIQSDYFDLFLNKKEKKKDIIITKEKSGITYKFKFEKEGSEILLRYSAFEQLPGQASKIYKDKIERCFPGQISTNPNDRFPYIRVNDIYNQDIIRFYSEILQYSYEMKTSFINDLKVFIPDLLQMEISTTHIRYIPELILWLKGVEQAIPFSLFGDGAIRLARIILEIHKFKDTRLMIDEIDTGIHYSRFKDYWRTILKAAIKNNVQLFMTTHNVECLRYLKEVLEEPEMQEYQARTRSYTLMKLPGGSIKSYKFDFGQFEFAIEQNNEIRGGR